MLVEHHRLSIVSLVLYGRFKSLVN